MKAIIERILIVNHDGEFRKVDLTPGVNIITGDSQTGKSALIDIIDYCLFSKRSSIPKYVITDYAYIYSTIFKLDSKRVIVARQAWNEGGSSTALVKIENNELNLDLITSNYFDEKSFIKLNDAQRFFEENIGLSVANITEEENASPSDGKASIRNITSFIFQHQNLIANKHALFYRFDDFVRRNRVIRETPIFLGWVDGAYYSYLRELDSLKKRLRREELVLKKIEDDKDDISNLKAIISSYLSYINYSLDENITLDKLKSLSINLPEPKELSINNRKQDSEIKSIDIQIQDLRFSLSKIEIEFSEIADNADTSFSYITKLKNIEKTLITPSTLNIIRCPLCKMELPHLEKEVKNTNIIRNKLLSDLSMLGSYNIDQSSRITELFKKRDSIKKEIKKLSFLRNELEHSIKVEMESSNFRDTAIYLKGRATASAENYLNRMSPLQLPDDLKELKERIYYLEQQITKYDLEKKYTFFNNKINKLMNYICDRLNFEDELKPANLHFNIETFEFYHLHKGSKVKISEMGSGSNWLACHLSLFLSLIILCAQEEKSIIPSILFLDQPSQVYFPRNTAEIKDEDIIQVENIFSTIIKLINSFKEEKGVDVQIIILEHADDLKLSNSLIFNDYVRKRWSKNGERLI